MRDYTGHGIGRQLHAQPSIPHYSPSSGDYLPAHNIKLRPGMVFSIQPMINQGSCFVRLLSDQWTAVTVDHGLSAQFEHIVVVTSDGVEILTLSEHPRENTP